MSQLCTIINYCTHDYRFLQACIEEAKLISSQVIVAVCDHFFDGTPENRALLRQSYQEHPDCLFVEFAYDPSKPYGLYCPYKPTDEDWAHYWHSTARYVAAHFLEEQIERILFLDVDEIIDGNRFKEWLSTFDYERYNAIRFYSHFYFRASRYRALSYTLNALLIKKVAMDSLEVLLTELERNGVFDAICGSKLNYVVGQDDRPLVDHYSWVRTKQELLHKVSTWGHRHDKDWLSLVNEEFDHPFLGKENLFNMHYEEIEPRFDPLKIDLTNKMVSQSDENFSHVKKVTSQDIQRMAYLKELSL